MKQLLCDVLASEALYGDLAKDKEADPIEAEIVSYEEEGFLLTFRRNGEKRAILIEQQGDDIYCVFASNADGDADAIVLLKDDCTEIHDNFKPDALRFGGRAGPQSISHLNI